MRAESISPLIECICQQCGATFYRHVANVRQSGATYCSRACASAGFSAARRVGLVCEHCGNVFDVERWRVEEARRKGRERRFCSKACQHAGMVGHLGAHYRGAKVRSANGYVRVTAPDGGEVLEHRLVMEQHIGRPLATREHVHHINGVRNDNRLENLQLLSSRDHHRLHMAERERDESGRIT